LRQAYTFLQDGESESASLTFEDLDLRARAIAAVLDTVRAADERVLLVYDPGLEYICGILGCLYARAVAVPVPSPGATRKMDRLMMVAHDSGANIVLTTRSILSRVETLLGDATELRSLIWLATDEIKQEISADWQSPRVSGDTLALLQYTSGSTTTPKGVMVTHANLLHNERLIQHAFNQTDQSLILSWLPLYHDMGLIGGVLQPLFLGARCIMMSPFAFLQRPLRWLQAISQYRVTTSGGPDFAYDLCVRKAAEQDCSSLDLGSWTVAFNGSEPIRNETIERFTETFRPWGFKRESFYPCYGLAEATLLVSGGAAAPKPLVKTVRAEALKRHRIIEADGGQPDSHSLVASGRVGPGHRVVVANPKTLTHCPEGRVGELWVSGPSVSRGYYNRPEETKQTYQAYLADTGEGPFLRTGDLGFIADDALFVTGRLKDLIIIRGQNCYPHDIESTIQRRSSALRQNCGAAFSIEVDGQERLVIVQEVETRRTQDIDEVIALIRQSVAEEHQLQLHAVTLIKTGSLPRTSSGKIRRHACRNQFLEGLLKVVAEWREPVTQESQKPIPVWDASLDNLAAAEKWLGAFISAKLGLELSSIDLNQSIFSYGLDSLSVIDLTHRLENSLGVCLPTTSFFHLPSLNELAKLISEQLEEAPRLGPIPARPPKVVTEFGLSRGQQALYFLNQFAPDDPVYNLAALGRVSHPFNAAALKEAFQKLIDRHLSLRTNFIPTSEGTVQRVNAHRQVCFFEVDAVAWTDEQLNNKIIEEARSRFNLEEDNLLRIILYERLGESWILLVMHHLVVDLWSLGALVKELGIFYSSQAAGVNAEIPMPAFDYSDYVQWQEEMLAGPEGDRLWEYWKERLGGELPVLELPTDRPRPPIQTYVGDSQSFHLPRESVDGLARLSYASGSTLFISLASAFEVFLHRYTGQEDILLGALTSGRDRAIFTEVVGYFVNPITLRSDFSDDPSFNCFLSRMRATVFEAFDHQAYPFPLLVQKLTQARDASRPPLIQAMLIYQMAHLPNQEALTRFAVGEDGARLRVGEIEVESLALNLRTTQFDLTLKLAATENRISGLLEYNADLFDASTIERMVGHFKALISGAWQDPHRPISELPMMRENERRQLLLEWNQTRLIFPTERCVHTSIEEQVNLTPDAVAVSFEDEQITYDQLNRRANQVAHRLRKLGVKPEARVGICMPRSGDMVVALLGILKSGGAYAPLDPSFPRERLSLMIDDSGLSTVIACQRTIESLPHGRGQIFCLDTNRNEICRESAENPSKAVWPENLAYVIYTSGSTGKPKGVMVSHRNVVNLFHAMDKRLGNQPGRWLAVTSISFDISVLELLWTLSRGYRLIIQGDQDYAQRRADPPRDRSDSKIDFSLFYFASDDQEGDDDRYRLLFEGAKFADRHGFTAVWTPERHFHQFGGLYPNPAVTGAALAAITEKVKIRAGSVVLPLHHPLRVAEEWSVVDNISKGRIGISVASGWHADDFVLAPQNYAGRKELMLHDIEIIRKLWRGEAVSFKGGVGNVVEARIFPRPVQRELPIWVTAAGSPETFQMAGEIGANLLTHMLGQSFEDLTHNISIYRQAWRKYGHGPGAGHVTLMVHTFIGEDLDEVRLKVRDPFCSYLKSSYGLIKNLARSLGADLESDNFTQDDMDALLSHAFDRYFQTSGLMGDTNTCFETVERIKSIGVDEVACLIDFGVETNAALHSLHYLERLKRQTNESRAAAGENDSVSTQIERHAITHLQCTPSMARLLTHETGSFSALQNLEMLLLGGEALPLSLAQELGKSVAGAIHNMYGPTETTIWSTTCLVEKSPTTITIGSPIVNTEAYILDRKYEPAPVNLAGKLYLGGEGVVRGYINSPDLTAERFVPDPFSGRAGSRIYLTGDVTRYLSNGKIEFLGRADQQVKLRGHRIELGEIEAALEQHPVIHQAAALVQEDSRGDKRLSAYIVCRQDSSLDIAEMIDFLRGCLPEYMIPADWFKLDAMPLSPNGKIYRRGLSSARQSKLVKERIFDPPRTLIEHVLADIWADVLEVNEVGIHDNFFEIGGHSILASLLVSRLREIFQIELPLRTFYEAPTVAKLAEIMTRGPDQGMRVQKIAELLTSVAGYTDDEVEAMLDDSCLIRG